MFLCPSQIKIIQHVDGQCSALAPCLAGDHSGARIFASTAPALVYDLAKPPTVVVPGRLSLQSFWLIASLLLLLSILFSHTSGACYHFPSSPFLPSILDASRLLFGWLYD
jgi:hypothetical protein